MLTPVLVAGFRSSDLGSTGPHRRTVYKLFTQYLDLFGKPSREFLKKLFPFAEAEALGALGALGPMAEKP